MSYGGGQKVQKVMVQPINLIFRWVTIFRVRQAGGGGGGLDKKAKLKQTLGYIFWPARNILPPPLKFFPVI